VVANSFFDFRGPIIPSDVCATFAEILRKRAAFAAPA
jgi:hypothetical protein